MLKRNVITRLQLLAFLNSSSPRGRVRCSCECIHCVRPLFACLSEATACHLPSVKMKTGSVGKIIAAIDYRYTVHNLLWATLISSAYEDLNLANFKQLSYSARPNDFMVMHPKYHSVPGE